jgi:hypothetical protein
MIRLRFRSSGFSTFNLPELTELVRFTGKEGRNGIVAGRT